MRGFLTSALEFAQKTTFELLTPKRFKDDLNELREQLDADGDIQQMVRIGLIISRWATVEAHVDLANWVILDNIPDAKQISPVLPVSLARKITCFADCHRRLSELDNLRTNALALAERLRLLSPKRHDFVHGLVVEERKGIQRVTRFRYSGLALDYEVKSFSTQDVQALIEEITQICHDLSVHLGRLVLLLVPAD